MFAPSALFFLATSPGEEPPDAALFLGAVVGLLFSLTALAERGRQRRLARLGVWNGPGRRAPSVRRGTAHAARREATAGVRWSVLGAWTAWWAFLTAALWLLGRAAGQPPALLGCAASALFVIVLGEAGDHLRRRCAARRTRARPDAGGQTGPLTGATPPDGGHDA
ncbi:hypothetical protein SCWH03_29240 [Streptomyces pacificus]|uniref:Uncharacterized protein n=2 Tax=Streptomyces pacificus TaxID=2705029 RepID=A0A6A0AUZ6_9ACTN|nr:hypothetical protein SCWH03_29240 [Streptomyces pacificus]